MLVSDKPLECLSEAMRELIFVTEWHFYASVRIYKSARAAIVDNHTRKAAGHGFDDNAGTEFPDRGIGKDVGLAHD